MTPDDTRFEAARLESTSFHTNGVRLHAVQTGPENGPLVLLLHGFPEFWYGWRHQLSPLAAAGYRVVAPDLRGYNRSEKPDGFAAYRIDELARDVVGLIDALDGDRDGDVRGGGVRLVGHDWGAALAWWVASSRPDLVERLGIINVPHPAVMVETLESRWSQRLRSWYVLFFQLPRVPEALARYDDWRLFASSLRRTSRPGTFTDADLRRYREAWSRPGAITAMLDWYRALRLVSPWDVPSGRIEVPTLVLWGVRDEFLEPEMARGSVSKCADGRLVLFENATHWVHHEEAERVNARLVEFFGE